MKKLLIHTKRLSATFLTVCLLTCTAHHALAQESIHRPIEIGLMAKNFSWSTELDQEIVGDQRKTGQVTLAPYIQISGPKGHFARLGMGLDIGQTVISTVRSGGNIVMGRSGNFSTIWLQTSALYGWEVNPFDGPFSKRFGFRFGAGLQHRLKLKEQGVTEITRIDTLQGNLEIESITNSNFGSQHLGIVGMAQLNFNPVNGLSLGIEWQMVAGLSYGAPRSHTTRTITNGGVVTTTDDRGFTYPFTIGKEVSLSSYPYLVIGWRF